MKYIKIFEIMNDRNEIGGSTLLRKLTRKSMLGFGKYGDITIGNILDLNHTQYLRWIYYNFDKITFTDDVLDEMLLPEEYRIPKPGKDIELHNKLNDKLSAKISGWTKFKNKSHDKKVKKHQSKQRLSQDRTNFKKSIMQARNHGKI